MAETERSCDQVLDLPVIQNKFKSSLGKLMRPCLQIKSKERARVTAQCLCSMRETLDLTLHGETTKT